MSNNQGSLTHLCMDAALPIDTSSEPFEFLSCSLKRVNNFAYSNGIRGQRSQVDHRVAQVSQRASGTITLNPSITELDRLWSRILGGATAGGVTTIADTIPQFFICVDKVDEVETFHNCVVSRATFSGSSGQPITLSLEIEAEKSDDTTTTPYPTLTLDTDDMFVMSDCTATIDSSPRSFSQFTLTVDNVVDTERQLNSLYRSEIPAQDSIITLALTMPQSGNTGLRDDGAAGVAGSFVVTDGAVTYTFTTGKMIALAPATEDINGKTEIFTPLTYNLFKSGATAQLTVTKT